MRDKDGHALVNGLKANDPIYQKIFVDMYAKRLTRIIMGSGLSREDALEVVNDSLNKVIIKIGQFDFTRGYKFNTWVVRIAINTARDKYRQVKGSPISQSTDERAEKGIYDKEAVWNEKIQANSKISQLSQKILKQALENLCEADKDILRCHASGFKHKEIAALMGKTPGAIKVAHHRAKKKLKKKYISLLESFEDKATSTMIKEFLGIEAVNEKTKN